jgi:hypothetical protein
LQQQQQQQQLLPWVPPAAADEVAVSDWQGVLVSVLSKVTQLDAAELLQAAQTCSR